MHISETTGGMNTVIPKNIPSCGAIWWWCWKAPSNSFQNLVQIINWVEIRRVTSINLQIICSINRLIVWTRGFQSVRQASPKGLQGRLSEWKWKCDSSSISSFSSLIYWGFSFFNHLCVRTVAWCVVHSLKDNWRYSPYWPLCTLLLSSGPAGASDTRTPPTSLCPPQSASL